jgi:hypothetical protein
MYEHIQLSPKHKQRHCSPRMLVFLTSVYFIMSPFKVSPKCHSYSGTGCQELKHMSHKRNAKGTWQVSVDRNINFGDVYFQDTAY